MALIKSIIILIIGFALLMKGADYFVEGSSSVAKQLHVPSMIIGMTIVAMGTSLPECAVSVTASLTGNNSLAVSNVVGSNIFNLMVVCGACALFAPLTIKKDTLKKEFPLSIICAALLMVLGYVGMLLGHLDGGVFLLIFAAYLIWMIGSAKKARAAHKESQMMREEGELVDEEIQILPLWKCALFIVGGMIAIKFGGDFVVDSASALASAFGLSQTLIGLTIVAMGTSLPETAVSVTASLVHNNELAVSNVVGSNIFNLMFVIGACAIMTPIMVQKDTIARDIPLSVICALLLLGLGYLAWGDAHGMTLGHLDGAVFLGAFAGYIFYMIRTAMKARAEGKKVEIEAVEELEDGELKLLSYPKSILCIVGGAVAIAFGGDMTVDAASRIAIDLGMSQTLVGLTIVSIGTSLPELVTSVVAARKNEVDMAVGNAVGSNIFNILMVLGVASAINPVALIRENIIDIVILIVFSLIVWIYAATKQRISRKEGISMVCMYLIYAGYIIWR